MKTMRRNRGFTLVEILIVVIILGILAAIVIPQFTNASTDARQNSLSSTLQTVRSQIELYKLQHNDTMPLLITTTPAWSVFTGKTKADGTVGATAAFVFGPYMQNAPVNPLNGLNTVDTAAAAGVGWVYDESTGVIHATNTDQSAVTTN
ncbi:MAG TPA: type II secretion system protein [Tepidisphaeraceae bacterium]|jgi:general secretion pathway protein G